nr:hypothetical protein [Mycolicibacterium poriferae]
MKEILSVAGQVLSGGAEEERPAVTATAALMIGFGICHMVVLLLGCQIAGAADCRDRSQSATRRKARGYSAAATTTETTRNAAQIHCAALREHELEAG